MVKMPWLTSGHLGHLGRALSWFAAGACVPVAVGDGRNPIPLRYEGIKVAKMPWLTSGHLGHLGMYLHGLQPGRACQAAPASRNRCHLSTRPRRQCILQRAEA